MSSVVLTCFLMVAFSFVPDFDIPMRMIRRKTKHRGITHTFLFGVVVGALLSIVLGYAFDRLGWLMGFVAGFGGTASHLLGDVFTFGSPQVRPLYPFSDKGLVLGLFKASNKRANNVMIVLGIVAFTVSYIVLGSL